MADYCKKKLKCFFYITPNIANQAKNELNNRNGRCKSQTGNAYARY